MKINDDKEYVNRRDIEIGIATEQPFKVCVHKCWGKNLTPLMDEIESSFKVHQYRMDNGVDYGKHELFFWTNCGRDANGEFPDLSYFAVELNEKTSVEERREVLARLIPIIQRWNGEVVGPKESFLYENGKTTTFARSGSYCTVDYHSELIGRDALHLKALENMLRIGKRKCEYGGMIGHFRHGARETLFQKLRTRKFYSVTDAEAARAKEVA